MELVKWNISKIPQIGNLYNLVPEKIGNHTLPDKEMCQGGLIELWCGI